MLLAGNIWSSVMWLSKLLLLLLLSSSSSSPPPSPSSCPTCIQKDLRIHGVRRNSRWWFYEWCGIRAEAVWTKIDTGYRGLKLYFCLYKIKLTEVNSASHDVTKLLRVNLSSYFKHWDGCGVHKLLLLLHFDYDIRRNFAGAICDTLASSEVWYTARSDLHFCVHSWLPVFSFNSVACHAVLLGL